MAKVMIKIEKRTPRPHYFLIHVFSLGEMMAIEDRIKLILSKKLKTTICMTGLGVGFKEEILTFATEMRTGL